jgi:hypothetical protein
LSFSDVWTYVSECAVGDVRGGENDAYSEGRFWVSSLACSLVSRYLMGNSSLYRYSSLSLNGNMCNGENWGGVQK